MYDELGWRVGEKPTHDPSIKTYVCLSECPKCKGTGQIGYMVTENHGGWPVQRYVRVKHHRMCNTCRGLGRLTIYDYEKRRRMED